MTKVRKLTEENSSVIYTITNKILNKFYVGASINFNNRVRKHKSHLKNGTHANPYLQIEWNKYGEDNFSFEVLEKVENKYLYSQENFWANMLSSHSRECGYNIKPTSPFKTGCNAQETKNKISLSLTGKIQTEESKNKRVISLKKTWASPELRELKRKQTLNLISLGIIGTKGKPSKKKGKPFQGDKVKLSNSLKAYYFDKSIRDYSSKSKGGKEFVVYKVAEIKRGNRWGKGYVIKGEKVFEGFNLTNACRELNIQRGNAKRCLRGVTPTVSNYFFEYKNTQNDYIK